MKIPFLIAVAMLFILATPSVWAGRPIPPQYADNWRILLRSEGGEGMSYDGTTSHFIRVRWGALNGKPVVFECMGDYNLYGGPEHSALGKRLVVFLEVDGQEVPLIGPYTKIGAGCDGVVAPVLWQHWFSPIFEPNYFTSGMHTFTIRYHMPLSYGPDWPPVVPGSVEWEVTVTFYITYP